MCISRPAARRCRGLTMIELIIFIVIVGVALAGLLSVFNVVVTHSADPVVRKNMLSIAEALLEEVQSHPYCSSTDTNCAISATTTKCADAPNRSQLGQVSDYGPSCSLPSPINDVSGSGSYLAPAGYTADIAVTAESLNGADTARISITVRYGNDSLVLEGYRARYWPDQDQSW